MFYPQSNLSSIRQQRGLALLAALLIMVIMAIIGFRVAEQGKSNTAITGSDVRYNQVFEAGEQSLRNSMSLIQKIHHNVGVPYSTNAPYKNYTGDKKSVFSDFNPKELKEELTTSPSYSFVWDSGSLGKTICGEEHGKSKCPSGIDFHKFLDGKDEVDIWKKYAIETSFSKGIDKNNYLSNIRTYTFIEVFDGGGQAGSSGGIGVSASEMEGSGGGSGKNYYYLITVKASGFPPGIKKDKNFKSQNARENVLLQTVYLQR